MRIKITNKLLAFETQALFIKIECPKSSIPSASQATQAKWVNIEKDFAGLIMGPKTFSNCQISGKFGTQCTFWLSGHPVRVGYICDILVCLFFLVISGFQDFVMAATLTFIIFIRIEIEDTSIRFHFGSWINV